MKYGVVFENYTERHYIKSFSKKYKRAWDITREIIQQEFEQIDLLFLKNVAETVVDSNLIKICKTEFKIAGTQESRHGSGNRCIVALHKDTNQVHILLVYSKTDLSGRNETAEWKQIIKENYPVYREML